MFFRNHGGHIALCAILRARQSGNDKFVISGAGALTVNGQGTTGAQTATFTATNKPGSGTTAPSKWLPIVMDGTTYYIPAWQ